MWYFEGGGRGVHHVWRSFLEELLGVPGRKLTLVVLLLVFAKVALVVY